MKNIFLILLILVLIYACVPLINDPQPSSFEPFIFTKISSEINGYTYRCVGYTKSYPGTPILCRDSTVFEIQISILLSKTTNWDLPFLVKIRYPDGKSEFILFNDEREMLFSEYMYDFGFEVTVKNIPELFLELGYFGTNGEAVFAPLNPFKSKMVRLN